MKKAFLRSIAVTVGVLMAGTAAWAGDPIVVWHHLGKPEEPTRLNFDKWNATHPDQQLELRFIPFGQLSQQFIKGIATGDVPDLITIDNPVVANFASQGGLEDLSERVAASTVIKKENYYPGSWATSIWQGKQFAVPGEANTLAIYYNTDMFKAKGLDPDKPPKTWAELKDYAEKLTDKSANVFGIAFSAIQSEEGTFQWLPFLQQSGATLKDLKSPDAAAALQLWADFVSSGSASKDVLIKRQSEMMDTFLSGGAAMIIGGPWELQRMSKDARVAWRVAKLPTRTEGSPEISALGGFVWGIPNGAKQGDEAFKVIEFMSEPEQQKLSWTGGRLPPVSNITVDNPDNPEAYAVYSEQMKVAYPRGPHPEWPKISAAIQTAIQSALTGQATPEEALATASEVVTPLLEKNPIDGM